MQVIIVSRDQELERRLKQPLRCVGFDVRLIERLSELGNSTAIPPAIVVLDLRSTPDGQERKRVLSARTNTPIVAILAKNTPEERCKSLEAGADACLGPEFLVRELIAKIGAVLRRMAENKVASETVELNGVHVDCKTRTVSIAGRPIPLTTVEFQLLETLVRSAGQFVTRDDLCKALHGRQATPFERSIDLHISRLRRKLTGERVEIKTLRSKGYQFCLPAATEGEGNDLQASMDIGRLVAAVASSEQCRDRTG